jgi:hypothetical protein
MARTFECRDCGDPFHNPTAKGRPPLRCVNCDPKAWSPEARAEALVRRRALEALEHRLPAAPASTNGHAPVRLPLRAPETVEDNPRLALALAVRHVGRADGRDELVAALTSLQRVVRAWLNAVA